MKRRSKNSPIATFENPTDDWQKWREGIIGLGEKSSRKTYYAELQRRMEELERFKALLNQSHEAIFLLEAENGTMTDVNATACLWLDYTKEELLCMNISEVCDEETARFLQHIYSAKENKPDHQQTVTTSLRGSSGSEIPVEMSLRLVEFGSFCYIVAVARDITEDKRMQNERKLILENVPVGIAFTKERNIIWMNRGAHDLFGFSREDLQKNPGSPLFGSIERYETFRAEALPVLTSGRPFIKEIQMNKKSGSRFWCQVYGKAANPENISEGIIWIIEDISQRKQIEETRRQLNKELEERVKVRTAELARANKEIQILNEQLRDENRQMRTEMELARRIQTSLLPRSIENIHPDFIISALMLPADDVGGDFYEITTDNRKNLWLAIGDVSGHGVTPGLIMMMAQTILTTINSNLECDARDIVIKINEILFKNVNLRLTQNYFMTFSAFKYLGEGTFQYAGAHLELFVYRQKSGKCEILPTRGTFLLFVPDISRATENSETTLEPGDILILYTDGFTEVRNTKNSMLDIPGFTGLIETHAHLPPEKMKQKIMTDVIEWCGNKRSDDMSLVIVKRKEDAVTGS